MKNTSIHSINALLQNSTTINNICQKLQQLQQLNILVNKLLPPEVAKHCSVANLRDGLLILTTSSPVWNHQINFLKIDLLEKLRKSHKEWAGISSILVKIDYLIEELPNRSHNAHNVYLNNKNLNNNVNNLVINPKTAELINSIANQEIIHQPLSDALKRLVGKRVYFNNSSK